MKRVFACFLTLLALAACYPNLPASDEERGRPALSLDFPSSTAPGSVETADLTVTNPGPEPMSSIVVAFSRLGDPSLPAPIVDVAPPKGEGAVKNVTPEPTGSSEGIIFTFDGLKDGESTTISFDLVMPVEDGPAGNAILVYDGQDTERARGVRLETEVGG